MKIRTAVLALAFAGVTGSAMADANSMNLLYPLNSTDPAGAGTGGGWTQSMARNDDGSTGAIELGFDFCLYQNQYNSVFINNNGNISFGGAFSTFTSTGFPTTGFQMIAPFWADVDTRTAPTDGIDTNLVWHKTVATSSGPVFVVTWDSVGYYNQQNNLRNTFQVAIAADANFFGTDLNAAFSYGDMQWTAGQVSGGAPATVGINNGDGIRFSQLGRFDHEGVDYNEQAGLPSGVSWLDNRDFFFNACEGIVPTPGAAALLGLGGVCAFRRRRN